MIETNELKIETIAPKRLRWWSSPRTLLRTILMLDDTPHSIALGTAIGMFIGLTPTVGLQMILVMVVYYLTRSLFQFNRLAALLTVYISNPITMIPMYWFNFEVGAAIVGGEVDPDDFARIFEYHGFWQWWNAVLELFVGIGWPLILGSAIVASIGGLLTYPAMRWLLRSVGKSDSFPSQPQPIQIVKTTEQR
jgi:uncharacterized protein